ncbi:triose-phosphate isomerase [Candidatus Woesebacteria bacterium]|nr:triose-phosphate isomerase [Candidatus Woesebacteria bacterium]QQG47598.1 MAG: triose-phosphate isomerase [Candidatus Woesebacteria bacterium]
MIFVNFKTYQESTGERGLSLLNILGEVAGTTSVPIIPVVSILDLAYFSGKTLLPLWVQHTDPFDYGAHTGFVLADEVFRLYGKGTFLNHSEHPISMRTLSLSVKKVKDTKLQSLVFAKDIETLEKVIKLNPSYVSYEPPELVGSTTTSVASAKPEIISEAVEVSRKSGVPLVVGAGIHSKEDVSKSIELGAKGIAVATNIVKAQDPKASLLNLLEGFKK